MSKKRQPGDGHADEQHADERGEQRGERRAAGEPGRPGESRHAEVTRTPREDEGTGKLRLVGGDPSEAGSDLRHQERAEGPVEGLQPGEKVERGPWRPPVEVDEPEGTAVPRDAAGEPDAVRRQKKRGGP